MRRSAAFAALILGSCQQQRYAPDACLWYVACLEEGGHPYAVEADAKYGADGSCWAAGAEERKQCATECQNRVEGNCRNVQWDTGREPPYGWHDTSDTAWDGEEPDGDPAISMTWDSVGLTVELEGIPTSGFDFGMAEAIDLTGGWFGEDCLNGTARYQECHVFDGTLTGRLTSIHEEVANGTMGLDDVQSGKTTLFAQDFASRLTYLLVADSGCFVWGPDTWYYLDSSPYDGCTDLS